MNPSNYMEYRDLQYERENIGYDEQYPEGGIKCKNYELCESIIPPDWYEYYANYFCMICDSQFRWGQLEFREADEDCAVCSDSSKKQVTFPANCGHWFCVACSRNILFWKEQRYHLSPVPYGCPPCPKGCVNPIKGEQCYCIEYDSIQDAWEESKPDEFKKWNDAEHESIDLSESTPGSVFSSQKCPMCRKVYKRS